MYELSVENAVSEIAQACEGKPDKKRSPFFFIVGAGISAPTIPLASEIESECKTIAAKYGRSIEPKSRNAIDSYSHWFELAFPNAEQRQRYLREKIQGKLISPAVFRLAHLLLSKAAGTIVVTPNFDDFLSRALNLFGEQHVICDHPSTVSRVSIEADDVQIVHVHGTYWFYDCCNLKAEITERAVPSNPGPVTITSFLEHLLWSRSPIVLGYSGWEGDVIMSALQKRLQSPMPFNLYWFCYKYSDSESLPAWIRENPRVRIVRPPATAPVSPGRSDEGKLEAAAPKSLGDKGFDPATLSARRVLDLLVTAFKLEAPQLTRDPLQFFVSQLTKSIFTGEDETAGVDIYSFQSVLGRVQTAVKLLQDTERVQSKIESALEEVRDAVRRSDYRNAIQAAKTISITHATTSQLEELVNLAVAAAQELNDNSINELEGYQTAIRSAQCLSSQGRLNAVVTAKWARALFLKGFVFGEMGRYEDEIATYDEVVQHFDKATELELREQVAKALFNKGWRLGQVNPGAEEIAVYDEVVRRFGEASELELREQVAKALVNKGVSLGLLNRSEDEIAVYDEVVRRFGEAGELELRERVARALVNKGVSLGQLNRREDEIAVYDEVVRRFGEASELVLRERVAKALFNKGVILGQLDRSEDAIAVYDEVVRRFAEASEFALREPVAMALFNKGTILGQLNRREDEIAVYDEVVRRFAEASEFALREQVGKALVNKGVSLGQLNRSEDAIAVCDEVMRRFGEASELSLREQVAKALFNKGWRLGQLNRNEDAIAVYDEVMRRFGEANELSLRRLVAKALFNKGWSLEQLSRSEDAIAIYDEVVRRFKGAAELALLEFAPRALLAQGELFKKLNQKERMLSICAEILQNFETRSEEELQVYVRQARRLMDEGNKEASSSAATS